MIGAPLNILLLGAGNRVSLCEWLKEAGKFYEYHVNLIALEAQKEVPISEYAVIQVGKKWNDPGFDDQLLETIKYWGIHIVLPLMDAATVELSRLKNRIVEETNGRCWPVVSSYELCKTMEDKLLSEKWFLEKQVNIPTDIRFPRIFKSIKGYGSRDQFIVRDQIELNSIMEIKDLSGYIDQPFIKGTEYTVDAYVTRQQQIMSVSRIRLNVINGEVSKGITKREPELLKEVERILSEPGFEGPITLQAIRSNSDDKFYFIEINPRFGGGAIQSFKAGADYTKVLLAEYLGMGILDCSKWEEGLLMMRCNREIWIPNHYNRISS